MAVALRCVVMCLMLAASVLLTPAAPAGAAEQLRMSVNLCEKFLLSPCPLSQPVVTFSVDSQTSLPHGCRKQFGSISPTGFYYYDPDLGAEYMIIYAGVAAEVICPQHYNLVAAAVSRPVGPSQRIGSENTEYAACPAMDYCEASVVWSYNVILPTAVCSYTVAHAEEFATDDVREPYFPNWTTGGYDCA